MAFIAIEGNELLVSSFSSEIDNEEEHFITDPEEIL